MATGAIDATKIRIAPKGHVYLAAALTAAPTDLSSTMSASWVDLGYCDANGVALNYAVNLNSIMSWQSAVVTKQSLKDVTLDLDFTLQQTTKAATTLFYGGATWTNGASGVATMSVPSNPSISSMEQALVVEYTDDSSNIQRIYAGRGIVSKRKAISLKRDAEVAYGFTFSVLDNSGTLISMLSNSTDLYSS